MIADAHGSIEFLPVHSDVQSRPAVYVLTVVFIAQLVVDGLLAVLLVIYLPVDLIKVGADVISSLKVFSSAKGFDVGQIDTISLIVRGLCIFLEYLLRSRNGVEILIGRLQASVAVGLGQA